MTSSRIDLDLCERSLAFRRAEIDLRCAMNFPAAAIIDHAPMCRRGAFHIVQIIVPSVFVN